AATTWYRAFTSCRVPSDFSRSTSTIPPSAKRKLDLATSVTTVNRELDSNRAQSSASRVGFGSTLIGTTLTPTELQQCRSGVTLGLGVIVTPNRSEAARTKGSISVGPKGHARCPLRRMKSTASSGRHLPAHNFDVPPRPKNRGTFEKSFNSGST